MTNSGLIGISSCQCKQSDIVFISSISLIVVTCATGPYSLAFPDDNSDASVYLDYAFNFLFFLDIIQHFFSAY